MAQFGRAPCSGRGGRKFESCRLDYPSHDRYTNIWPVGQGVKTPPSHGGNRGSIPLSTATEKPENIELSMVFGLLFFVCFEK